MTTTSRPRTIPPCWLRLTRAMNAGGGPLGAAPGAGGGGGVELISTSLTSVGVWTKYEKPSANR